LFEFKKIEKARYRRKGLLSGAHFIGALDNAAIVFDISQKLKINDYFLPYFRPDRKIDTLSRT